MLVKKIAFMIGVFILALLLGKLMTRIMGPWGLLPAFVIVMAAGTKLWEDIQDD